jgi:hypothetical protein
MAALLAPGGVFASFGGQMHLADTAVSEAVQAVRTPYLVDDGIPSPDGTPEDSPMQWPGTELVESDDFADVRQLTIDRRTTVPAAEYLGHLSTISAYLELAQHIREQLFEEILGVLPESVSVAADLTVHLARRRR